MTVNPKKMRPYDEPPRRRRTLIPDAPDSAAAGFLVAGAIWLAAATGIGLVAIVIRMIPFELSYPIGIFDLGFTLDERRVDYAFLNATVYGWLSNAGFAAVAFMTPRLLGRRLVAEKLLNLGLAIWNLSLAGGLALLYVLELGPHAALTAFPWFVDGGLATGALVITGVFLVTVGASVRGAYISTWFAGIALLSFLGLLSLNAGLGLLETFLGLGELPTALASVFIERAVSVLWLLGMGYATLHYVVPRAVGQPLASGGLALLTWLTWLVLAPVSALAVLADASIPFFVTTLGSVATMMLLVPAALAVVNLVQTMHGRWSVLFGVGTAAFASVALAFLIATSLLEAIGSIHAVQLYVARTDWELGLFAWAAYGAFSLIALALVEHGMPRILRRAWGGGFLSAAQLWLIFGGATIAGMALMGAGMAEASLLAQGTSPDALVQGLLMYRVTAFIGFIMLALGGLALLINLFLLYTSGQRADYVAPGHSATAPAGH